jgi:5S rRNA maturation endonuclease (ribonuclease M5)
MSRISEQQVIALSRIPLEHVLIALGAQRDHADHSKWRTAAGTVHLGRSNEKQLYNSFDGSGLKGGGPIDLVRQVQNIGFREAVDWLDRTFPNVNLLEPSDSLFVYNQQEVPKPATRVPEACEATWKGVRKYLVEKRRLNPTLIDTLHQRGEIVSDRKGNAVFFHQELVGCEVRGCVGKKFVLSFGRKTGFVIAGQPGKETWLVESAIDAISLKQLRPEATVISLGGDNATLERRYLTEIRGTVIIGYDNDKAGQRMAKRAQQLRDDVIRVVPYRAKDWNDALYDPRRQAGLLDALNRRLYPRVAPKSISPTYPSIGRNTNSCRVL